MSCIGEPLYLKNLYGEGYRLTLISKTENIRVIKQFVINNLPSAKILDESGGNVIIMIPLTKLMEL